MLPVGVPKHKADVGYKVTAKALPGAVTIPE